MAERGAELLEPGFLVGVPSSRDVPGGQPASLRGLAQTVAALVAHRSVYDVATLVGVGGSAEERHLAAVAVVASVVDVVLFACLLEVGVVVARQPTHVVLHTYAVPRRARTLHVVDFHTSIYVEDVYIVEHIVVCSRGTHIP